jgi:hypothetical protein
VSWSWKALPFALVVGCGILAGCGGGSPPHTGPPKPASLAAKLGCHVTGPDTSGMAAYDTAQYVDAQGGSCSDASLITDQGIVILTFPSEAKETDWLHQNAQGENGSTSIAYFEVVSGHLWAIAN